MSTKPGKSTTLKVVSMVEMYHQGYSIRQVAAAHRVTYNTVHYHLTGAGVKLRARGGIRRDTRLPDPEPAR